MVRRVGAGLAVAVGLWATNATATEEWKTVLDGPLTVKTRDVAGSDVHEYEVTGSLDAPVAAVQATLTDPESFTKFMPHVTESRVLKREDGVERVYTKVDPPVGDARDYVTEVKLLESVKPDGSGTFRQAWHALSDAIPQRSGVTRVTVNEGSWTITSSEDGKTSKMVYRFRVDPGGWVPGFLAEMANKKAIPATIHAIEREAQRRAHEPAVGGSGSSGT